MQVDELAERIESVLEQVQHADLSIPFARGRVAARIAAAVSGTDRAEQ